jgi:diguanylate cyclase (GGDEF)-like protein/PAS domain S-box-containing protein
VKAVTSEPTRPAAASLPARLLQVGFERASLGVGMTDMNAEFTAVNPALCAFLGRAATELIGASPYDFMEPHDAAHIATLATDFMTGATETFAFEGRFVRPDDSIVWGRVSLSLVVGDAGFAEYVFGQVEDVTARKVAEDSLAYQAMHDVLTGLPNRTLLAERLDRALARSSACALIAVMFVDLDEFKVINDAMGHDVGDEVLIEMGRRLVEAVRTGDTIARFGGDEFVVMCRVRTQCEARQIARRILDRMGDPLHVLDMDLSVTASVGIAIADACSTGIDLVRGADTAMYRAKEKGRGCIEMYTDAMGSQATTRLRSGLALRRALDHDELSVAYQPIVRLDGESLAGVEALARWIDPVRGSVPPEEFIALAEASGQIFRIGELVTKVALHDVERLRRTVPGADDLTVAVNLSARQFNDPALPAAIAASLAGASVPAAALHLEITETAVMRDVDAALAVLLQLRHLGVHVNVDDFGTGYSSLSYLKRLPVTTLKIDRSFVDRLGTDTNDTAIVASIIALAHALGLSVIAEGVETPTQLAELRRLGCEFGQGHLWSAALSADALAEWITAREHGAPKQQRLALVR